LSLAPPFHCEASSKGMMCQQSKEKEAVEDAWTTGSISVHIGLHSTFTVGQGQKA